MLPFSISFMQPVNTLFRNYDEFLVVIMTKYLQNSFQVIEKIGSIFQFLARETIEIDLTNHAPELKI